MFRKEGGSSLVLVVELPLCDKLADFETEQTLSTDSGEYVLEILGRYSLRLRWPEPIDEARAAAKFISGKRLLQIWAPLLHSMSEMQALQDMINACTGEDVEAALGAAEPHTLFPDVTKESESQRSQLHEIAAARAAVAAAEEEEAVALTAARAATLRAAAARSRLAAVEEGYPCRGKGDGEGSCERAGRSGAGARCAAAPSVREEGGGESGSCVVCGVPRPRSRAPANANGSALKLGMRVRVWWGGDNKYYGGEIESFRENNETLEVLIAYDDTEKEWENAAEVEPVEGESQGKRRAPCKGLKRLGDDDLDGELLANGRRAALRHEDSAPSISSSASSSSSGSVPATSPLRGEPVCMRVGCPAQCDAQLATPNAQLCSRGPRRDVAD